MFKTAEGFKPDAITKEATHVERNYVIQRNDYLKLDVYSNKGERLIDPNPELSSSTGTPSQNEDNKVRPNYLVDLAGITKFPMIGEIKVEGLTLRQAEAIIQKEYEKYFKEPFAVLTYANKRVIVLGAPGGQVIPITNQNMNLTEVLALAKGVDNNAKAQNIRVLRNEQVFVIDLSTIEGYKSSNLLIQPGDIVYIEPIRRPVSEAFKDYAGIFSVTISLVSLVIVLTK